MAKKQQSIGVRTLHLLCDVLVYIIEKAIKLQLWIDRKIIKRHLQIETPLYRCWHRNHAKSMQRKLDLAHGNYGLIINGTL